MAKALLHTSYLVYLDGVPGERRFDAILPEEGDLVRTIIWKTYRYSATTGCPG